MKDVGKSCIAYGSHVQSKVLPQWGYLKCKHRQQPILCLEKYSQEYKDYSARNKMKSGKWEDNPYMG